MKGVLVNWCIFRYKETFFRNKEAVTKAKEKLVSLVVEAMDPEEAIVQEPSSSTPNAISEDEPSTSMIAQISKKIRLEKKLEVICCVSSVCSVSRLPRLPLSPWLWSL